MKLDILAFGAHPDDVELSCSGTIAKEMVVRSKIENLNIKTPSERLEVKSKPRC